MKNKIIGIEGTQGSGKSTIINRILKRKPDTIAIEVSNLFVKYSEIIVALRQTGNNDEDILEYLKDIPVNFKIENQRVIFDIQDTLYVGNTNSLLMKNILLDYQYLDKLIPHGFDIVRKAIKEYKDDHTIFLDGRYIKRLYPEADHFFSIVADTNERLKRVMMRDGVDRDAVKFREEKESKRYLYGEYIMNSEDTIIIDTTDANPENFTDDEKIEKMIRREEEKSDIIKVNFSGAASTGKSTLCEYCAKNYGEPYAPELIRTLMEEKEIEVKDISEELFIEAAKLQQKDIYDKEKQAKEYLFTDSGPLIFYFGLKYLFNKESDILKEMALKFLEDQDVIAVCDNNIPFDSTLDRADEGTKDILQNNII